MRKLILPLFVLMSLMAAGAHAQQPPASSSQPPPKPRPTPEVPPLAPAGPDFVIPKPEGATVPPQPAAQAAAPERYVIGANDTLAITVVGEAEFTNKYRVDSDGSITLPYINRVPAAGLSVAELQSKIASMLRDGYLQNPQVLIDVDSYKSRNVYVTGNVRTPGRVPMNGPTITLIEALALAGSPTSDASSQITVKHQRTGEVITVNKKEMELGNRGFDIALEDGDVVNVPAAQRFYITGFIRNSGYYVLDPGMTVQQAIALAGGLMDRGSDRRITATRMVDGKLTEVKVEKEDKVQPNDVIKIPSRFF
jgi:polysaccharide biosynthesis/export protein